MFRGPPKSRASATTLCQKCLKRGHYSYECQVSAQQRPYKPRPSRTQQLLNPDLKPKLTTEVPNDLIRRKGVADEILAKKEEERAGKSGRSRQRSRSVSSYSSDSVSTISTTRSRSRSRSRSPQPPPKAREENGKASSHSGKQKLGKRDRRSTSSGSDRSDSPREMRESADRNTRRRMSSSSPVQRGRRRTRSHSNHMEISHEDGLLRRGDRRGLSASRSRSRSHSRRAPPRSHISRGSIGKQRGRRLSVSRSRSRSSARMDISDDRHPPKNGNARAGRSPRRTSPPARHLSTSRSRSRSPKRGRRGRSPRSRSSIRAERSPSPFSRRAALRSPSPFRGQNGSRGRGGSYGGRGRGGHFNGGGRQFDDGQAERNASNGPSAPVPQKERSLSPYSKRVALTRQMHGGS